MQRRSIFALSFFSASITPAWAMTPTTPAAFTALVEDHETIGSGPLLAYRGKYLVQNSADECPALLH